MHKKTVSCFNFMSCIVIVAHMEIEFFNPTKMKNRSRIDILAQILRAVNGTGGGITKTKIMYNALLSYAQMQQYLLLLTEKGLLLQYNKTMHTFNITEKGLKFLEIYNK